MYKLILGLVSLIGMLLLSGCATTKNYQQVMNEWQGAKAQDLVRVWGNPDSAVKLPNGNTTYMYYRQQQFTTPSSNAAPTFGPFGTTRYSGGFAGMYGAGYGQTVSLYCRTLFEINSQGIIVSTQYHGNNCVAGKNSRWQPTS